MKRAPDFHQPPPQAKDLAEAQQIINELWSALGALQAEVEQLKERIGTNSSNSSTPPSADRGTGAKQKPDRAKPRSGRGRGAQPGHKGHRRELLPSTTVDELIPYYPPARCPCGGVVRVFEKPAYRHQVYELPAIAPLVQEYQRFDGVCEGCGERHRGLAPAGMPRGQLGPGVLALVGLLGGRYHLSQAQSRDLLAELLGIDFSLGAVSQAQGEVALALEPLVAGVRQAVRQARLCPMDETRHYFKGEARWLWVVQSPELALFETRASRGQWVAKELLGEDFAGILVSDRYAGYAWVDAQHRQLCWAHVLRDFERIRERPGVAGVVGRRLSRWGYALFRLRERQAQDPAGDGRYQRRLQRVRERIRAVLEQGAALVTSARTANTCGNLLAMESALWRFLSDPDVPPTNNCAERSLRGYVIWRKTRYSTQSKRGDHFIERILTVVETCKLQGRKAWDLLRQALHAHVGFTAPPSLLPT